MRERVREEGGREEVWERKSEMEWLYEYVCVYRWMKETETLNKFIIL